jgi:hypothetical protein
MGPRIQLIHAMAASQGPTHKAFSSLWPEAHPVDLVDASLATDLAKLAGAGNFPRSALARAFSKRMATLVSYSVETGADAILFTCSAFGAAIEEARLGIEIPVLKPDEAMILRALHLCKAGVCRIGGLATFKPTIPSLTSELEAAVENSSICPEIVLRYVPHALEQLNKGNKLEHDRLIIDASTTMTNLDVLLLAQFSMSSTRDAISQTSSCEVLASPTEAVLQLKSMFS